MAWVDGKPKMVSERYLGTGAEIEALLDAREAAVLPDNGPGTWTSALSRRCGVCWAIWDGEGVAVEDTAADGDGVAVEVAADAGPTGTNPDTTTAAEPTITERTQRPAATATLPENNLNNPTMNGLGRHPPKAERHPHPTAPETTPASPDKTRTTNSQTKPATTPRTTRSRSPAPSVKHEDSHARLIFRHPDRKPSSVVCRPGEASDGEPAQAGADRADRWTPADEDRRRHPTSTENVSRRSRRPRRATTGRTAG